MGRLQFGRIGWAARRHGGTFQNRSQPNQVSDQMGHTVKVRGIRTSEVNTSEAFSHMKIEDYLQTKINFGFNLVKNRTLETAMISQNLLL